MASIVAAAKPYFEKRFRAASTIERRGYLELEMPFALTNGKINGKILL
jgi:hypothetical protein